QAAYPPGWHAERRRAERRRAAGVEAPRGRALRPWEGRSLDIIEIGSGPRTTLSSFPDRDGGARAGGRSRDDGRVRPRREARRPQTRAKRARGEWGPGGLCPTGRG